MNDRERLEYIINKEGLTSKQFSEMVGIGAGTISNIMSGRNKASLDVLQRVRARFPKYNATWLYEGVGEITISGKEYIQEELPLVETAPSAADTLPVKESIIPQTAPVAPVSVPQKRQIERIVIFYSDGTFEER